MTPVAQLAAPGVRYLYARRHFRHRLASLAALAAYLGPSRGRCPRCRAGVLVVGADIPLDPNPIVPLHPCPLCEQVGGMGHVRRGSCWRCGGTGQVGEALPKAGAFAVDQVGAVRAFGGRRRDGEAVHLPHVCADG